MARHRTDWSELFPELLISIAGRLGMYDVIQFRAVCKNWRSAIPQIPPHRPLLSPLFPHQLSTIPSSFSEPPYVRSDSLVIVANTTFLLRSRQPNPNYLEPWLVTVEEFNPGKFILRKPLTRCAFETWFNDFPRAFNLCDFNVREICKAYNFRVKGDLPCLFADDELWRWYNSKVILFFNPSSVSRTVEDCYAVVVNLNDRGKLLYVRLRDEEDNGNLHCGEVSCFDDIVNYREGVWAIDREGRVYVVHYNSNALKLVMFSDHAVCTGDLGNRRKRLVESSDGLYLIARYYNDCDNNGFRVYKLSEGARKWDEVKSLNGRILFVSTDCCFFASVEDFPGCVGNCIFFPKHHFPTYNDLRFRGRFFSRRSNEEYEIGVFFLDDGECCSITNYPGYSDIFCPPPKRLFRDPCSSRRKQPQPLNF